METILIVEKSLKVASYLFVFFAAFVEFHRLPKAQRVSRIIMFCMMVFAGTDVLEIIYKADRISYSQLGLNICYALFLGRLVYIKKIAPSK
jgi:hypothetical protein